MLPGNGFIIASNHAKMLMPTNIQIDAAVSGGESLVLRRGKSGCNRIGALSTVERCTETKFMNMGDPPVRKLVTLGMAINRT